MSSLDEQTHGEDLDWGEVRSACAERDWRRAWEAVGTDHRCDATPGEIYIFGAARRLSAVSAAMRHWYLESLGLSGFGGRDQTWKDRYARIKVIASWESSAAAQHVSRVKPTMGVDMASGHSFSAALNGVDLTYFDESARFTREAFDRMADTLRAGEVRIPSSVQGDARAVLDDMLTKGSAERLETLPGNMRMTWVDHEGSPLDDLIRAANQPRMSGTLVMSQGTARALRNLPELRTETTFGVDGHRRVIDALAGDQVWVVPNDFIKTNPNPRGPAQRKRRGG